MKYAFRRLVRTSSSEQWLMYLPGVYDELGTIDLHIKDNHEVHATMVLTEELDDAEFDRLIEEFDDDVVDVADIEKGNFFLRVFQGTDKGTFKIELDEDVAE